MWGVGVASGGWCYGSEWHERVSSLIGRKRALAALPGFQPVSTQPGPANPRSAIADCRANADLQGMVHKSRVLHHGDRLIAKAGPLE